MTTPLIKRLIAEAKKTSTPERAKTNAWFFKTAPGQYGYGDVFIGLTVPACRNIAKKYKDLSLAELEQLLSSKIHEHRLIALEILVIQFQKADTKLQKNIIKFYLSQTKNINNWDLVDASASYILGNYLASSATQAPVLNKLAASRNLWERRIAIVSTYAFIKQGIYSPTLAITEKLMRDTHDLIHKACGWMLREVGKKDEKVLKIFLEKHKAHMPRTELRYAIERFSAQDKAYFMKKTN